jgi:hypothetical protein
MKSEPFYNHFKSEPIHRMQFCQTETTLLEIIFRNVVQKPGIFPLILIIQY